MALESATYISDLVSTNPAAGDAKSQGDDHIRLVKSTVKATFPNVSGAVTPTHTELNYVDGVTSAIQTQINTKAAHAGQAYTGAHDFSGASGVTLPAATSIGTVSATEIGYVDGVTSAIQTQLDGKATLNSPTFTGTPAAPTAATGTATTQLATTAFVANTAFSSTLPAQTGNNGKYLKTDGTNASWQSTPSVPAGASIYTALNFGGF